SARFPGEVLVSHNGRDRRFYDVYRADLATGRSERVFENYLFGWVMTDSAFRVRLAGRTLADGSLEVLERRPSAGWTPFMTVTIGDLDGTWLHDVSEDGTTLYAFDTRRRDKAALVAIDIATRRMRVLAHDSDADIKRVILHPVTHRPLAAGAVVPRV